MTLLYISEHESVFKHPESGMAIPSWPPLATYTVASGAAGPAFNNATRFIRINADSVFSFRIGPNQQAGSATTTDPRISANASELAGVIPTHNIAAITNT